MDTNSFSSFYKAFKSKDKGLDGKYFMSVSSTSIYCRPEPAPRNTKVDSSKRIFKKELKIITDGLLEENNLQELSLKLGYKEPHRYEALLNFLKHCVYS